MASDFPKRGVLRTVSTRRDTMGATIRDPKEVKRKSSSAAVSYRSMEIETENMFQRTKLLFGHVLEDETIRQIYAYARSIPILGTMDVDKPIFGAQMMRYFDLTNAYMLQRMYHVAAGKIFHSMMNVEQYVKLICTFISEDLDIKIRFAFDVYDTMDKGELEKRDYETLLKQVHLKHDSDEPDELCPRTLVLLILAMCDLNGDGKIDHEEFSYLIHGNRLLMQCLGHCLPEQEVVKNFMEPFGDKTTLEVRAIFRDERRKALRGLEFNKSACVVQKYYPIPLHLP